MHHFNQDEINIILNGDEKHKCYFDFNNCDWNNIDLEDKKLYLECERIYANWRYFLLNKVSFYSCKNNKVQLKKFIKFCVENKIHPLEALLILNDKSRQLRIKEFYTLPIVVSDNILTMILEERYLRNNVNKIENTYASSNINADINGIIRNQIEKMENYQQLINNVELTDRFIQSLIAVMKDTLRGARINCSSNIKLICEYLLKNQLIKNRLTT